jgi:enamine deaminase RidA (YjgF/YER057c/UK114 family)
MITRIKAGPRMSQAVVHGNTVYLAGQVASSRSADTASQTREILAAIDGLLAEAGTDKSRLLAATIYLTDMSTFNEMNAVWDAWVAPGSAPARATVGAQLASSAYRVEIVVIAALP